MSDTDELLRQATGGVLALWDDDGDDAALVVLDAPAWWDGAGLWLAAPQAASGAASLAEALRERPACTVLLDGVAVRGQARLFGTHDPVALALHGPAIAGAMAALALRGPAALRHAWPGALPRELVVRVGVEAAEPLRFPPVDGGIAPALPADVPADVRRELAGVRDVVVLPRGYTGGHPASWSGGMAIEGLRLAAGRAAVVVRAGGTGLALEGLLDEAGRLAPERAQWWRDGRRGDAPVRSAVRAIVLPD